jgi:hypothetical protein
MLTDKAARLYCLIHHYLTGSYLTLASGSLSRSARNLPVAGHIAEAGASKLFISTCVPGHS